MIRVFHADDSSAYRLLVRELLADVPDIEHVGEAADAAATLAALPEVRADVVLLDTLDEEGLLDRVRGAAPGARVVVLTGMPRGGPTAAVAGAADAFVNKAEPFTELCRVIRAVAGQP